MFYFAQRIALKNQEGELVFQKESADKLTFKKDDQFIEFSKSDFPIEDVILTWENVKLFGKSKIKRLARAY